VAIVAAVLAAACIGVAPASAQEISQAASEINGRIQPLQPFIAAAAARFHVPESWVRAVIAAESGGRTEVDGGPITSPAGAIGPMQVMPRTYQELRLRYGLGSDPGDPEQNILAGTAYMGELYRRFGLTGMFAAYNAGPDRYQQFLDTGRPLPPETVAYLKVLNVTPPRATNSPEFGSGRSLFFPLGTTPGAGSAGRPEASNRSVFVTLDQSVSDLTAEKNRH
jgi:soluble lytic murein transglycosylase-like protein